MPASSIPGVVLVVVMFGAFIIGLAGVQAWVTLGGRRPARKPSAVAVAKAEDPTSTQLAA